VHLGVRTVPYIAICVFVYMHITDQAEIEKTKVIKRYEKVSGRPKFWRKLYITVCKLYTLGRLAAFYVSHSEVSNLKKNLRSSIL
jgi:hypothetical protein